MQPLTRDDIVGALGETDDAIVIAIIGTGATASDLAEARAWMVNDEPLMNSGRPLASGRVGQLVEILQSVEEQEPGPAGHPT